jgi:hypothetical protein
MSDNEVALQESTSGRAWQSRKRPHTGSGAFGSITGSGPQEAGVIGAPSCESFSCAACLCFRRLCSSSVLPHSVSLSTFAKHTQSLARSHSKPAASSGDSARLETLPRHAKIARMWACNSLATALQASNLYSRYDQYFAIVGYWDRVELGIFGRCVSGVLLRPHICYPGFHRRIFHFPGVPCVTYKPRAFSGPYSSVFRLKEMNALTGYLFSHSSSLVIQSINFASLRLCVFASLRLCVFAFFHKCL